MKIIVDIESTNLLQNGLDYSSLPYKLKPDYKIWCVVFRNISTGVVTHLEKDEITKENMQVQLAGCTELIGHNIVQFDLPVLMLYGVLDYRIGYPGEPTTVFGQEVKITDTLLWSKLLNADRLGGHSLSAWGKRLGNYKEHFDDWNNYSQEMLEYCIQDTNVNLSIYKRIIEEQGNHPWDRPYFVELKLADLTLKQELFGFEFNKDLAEQNLQELTELMQNIARKVDPLLPLKQMSRVEASFYVPPRVRFKKDGSVSSHMEKFLTKLGATLEDNNQVICYEGKRYPVTIEEPLKSTVTATVEDINVVKSYLLSLGWVPTEVKERDLVKNQDKTTKNYAQIVEAIDRYVKQTETSLFRDLRLSMLETTMENLRAFLLKKIDKEKLTKPIYVPSTPKLTVGVEKEICPNLAALGEKAEFVKDVVHYYTYRHRKNSIAGGELDEDGEPVTGFLSAVREDGRIPTPADTLGANTGRYRHRIVCNIPRVTSLYGEQMRNLFGSGKSLWQLGYDFASLEARIMGHYVMPYTEGVELANALVAEKPNDIHCYREDTEILTECGWKTFGKLLPEDKVAQFNQGVIEFVVPTEIVWQEYEGNMLHDPVTNFSVTPNHRVYYESFHIKQKGGDYARVVEASDFKPSSGKHFVTGGFVNTTDNEELTDNEIRLIVATHIKGHFNRDDAGMQFTFSCPKDRKINYMENLLNNCYMESLSNSLDVVYKCATHEVEGKDVVKFEVPVSPFALKIRSYLTDSKEFSPLLLKLSSRQMKVFINAMKDWTGTFTGRGYILLNTGSKTTADLLQAFCALTARKCKVARHIQSTKVGACYTYGVYISKKEMSNTVVANKECWVYPYKGFVGCVSVPSGLVLVRRGGMTVISGNTLNAKKLGIERSAAKSFSYAAIYGAQPKKLAKMLGITEAEGKKLFNEYWEAVPALKELKDRLEKVWERSGKKHIPGLDGRLLMTRSKHSLVNVLFQSGGAIAAKWSAVRLAQAMEREGILGDPFLHTLQDVKIWWLIHMHDEQQMAGPASLFDVKVFATEEEAKAALQPGCSAIGHGKKGPYLAYKTKPIFCIEEGIASACKELGLRVDLGFEYIVGKSWGQCH